MHSDPKDLKIERLTHQNATLQADLAYHQGLLSQAADDKAWFYDRLRDMIDSGELVPAAGMEQVVAEDLAVMDRQLLIDEGVIAPPNQELLYAQGHGDDPLFAERRTHAMAIDAKKLLAGRYERTKGEPPSEKLTVSALARAVAPYAAEETIRDAYRQVEVLHPEDEVAKGLKEGRYQCTSRHDEQAVAHFHRVLKNLPNYGGQARVVIEGFTDHEATYNQTTNSFEHTQKLAGGYRADSYVTATPFTDAQEEELYSDVARGGVDIMIRYNEAYRQAGLKDHCVLKIAPAPREVNRGIDNDR